MKNNVEIYVGNDQTQAPYIFYTTRASIPHTWAAQTGTDIDIL